MLSELVGSGVAVVCRVLWRLQNYSKVQVYEHNYIRKAIDILRWVNINFYRILACIGIYFSVQDCTYQHITLHISQTLNPNQIFNNVMP